MNAATDPLRLYELVLGNGRSASPYVWRVRYALAHKGLDFEPVGLGLTDLPTRFGGRLKTVPILEHGSLQMAESWDIVEYLERTFPARPLFASPAEAATVRLVDTWFGLTVGPLLFRTYVLDIHAAAGERDRAYFRQTREQRVGMPLEAFVAEREQRLPALRAALEPLRVQLARSPWLGGAEPNYADYIVLSSFQWVASVATLPPLAADDARLLDWLGRGFDRIDGGRRDPRLRPLAG